MYDYGGTEHVTVLVSIVYHSFTIFKHFLVNIGVITILLTHYLIVCVL